MAIDKAVDSTVLDEYFGNIADAIRAKTGGTAQMTPADMPAEIGNIVGVDTLKAAFDGTLDTWTYNGTQTILQQYTGTGLRASVINLPGITQSPQYGFSHNNVVEYVHMPDCLSIGREVFSNCSMLKEVKLDSCKNTGRDSFKTCNALTTVYLPSIETFSTSDRCFSMCSMLKTIDTGKNNPANYTSIANICSGCVNLDTFIIRKTSGIVALTNAASSVFSSSKIAGGTGYIYVPAALVSEYEAATNWSTLAGQFRALEDYTVDGTTTGDLDPSKI